MDYWVVHSTIDSGARFASAPQPCPIAGQGIQHRRTFCLLALVVVHLKPHAVMDFVIFQCYMVLQTVRVKMSMRADAWRGGDLENRIPFLDTNLIRSSPNLDQNVKFNGVSMVVNAVSRVPVPRGASSGHPPYHPRCISLGPFSPDGRCK